MLIWSRGCVQAPDDSIRILLNGAYAKPQGDHIVVVMFSTYAPMLVGIFSSHFLIHQLQPTRMSCAESYAPTSLGPFWLIPHSFLVPFMKCCSLPRVVLSVPIVSVLSGNTWFLKSVLERTNHKESLLYSMPRFVAGRKPHACQVKCLYKSNTYTHTVRAEACIGEDDTLPCSC
jgi:hypothetical protein